MSFTDLEQPSEHNYERIRRINTNSSSQASKRRRVSLSLNRDVDLGTYQTGSIFRLRMVNIMTYGDVEFHPGPRVNLIVGPNASGKSTIMCSLALVLAGGPLVLERADSVKEFVRRGENKGFIEIELIGRDQIEYGNLTIRRTLNSSDNRSDWKISSNYAASSRLSSTHHLLNRLVNTTKEHVLSCIRSLGINIDNICQFLPQERVSKFALLKKRDLLLATLESCGENELISTFRDLGEDYHTLTKHLKCAEQGKEKLAFLERESRSLGEIMKRMEDQKTLETKLENLKIKEAFILLKEKRDFFQILKGQVRQLMLDIEKHEQVVDRFAAKVVSTKQKLQACIAAHETCRDTLHTHRREYVSAETKFSSYDIKIEALITAHEEYKRECDAIKEEIIRYERELANLKKQVETLEASFQKKTKEFNEAKQHYKTLSAQMNTARLKKNELAMVKVNKQKKLTLLVNESQSLRNVKYNRIHKLQQQSTAMSHKSACRAWTWLQKKENKTQLRGQVYGPLFLELNIADQKIQNIVEMAIPSWWLFAFLVESLEDQSKLSRLLGAEGIEVTITTVMEATLPRPNNPSFFQTHDIDIPVKPLLDLFDTPSLIKKSLCDIGNFHKILICDDSLERYLDELPPGTYFSNTNRFLKAKSKYSSNVIIEALPIPQSKYLTGFSDHSRISELQKEIEIITAEQTSIDEEIHRQDTLIRNVTIENEANREKQLEYQKYTQQLRQTEKDIVFKKRRVDDLRKECDIETVEQELKRKLFILRSQKIEQAHVLNALVVKKTELLVESVPWKMRIPAIHEKLQHAQSQLQVAKEDLQALLDQKKGKGDQYVTAKAQFMNAKQCIQKYRPVEEYALIFENLPNSLEEIQIIIEEIEKQLSLAQPEEFNVREKYEQIMTELTTQQATSLDLAKKVETDRTTLLTLGSRWTTQVTQIVATVNTSFEKFFVDNKCNGAVVLDIPSDPNNFGEYGIILKVRFREGEKFGPLDPMIHSGGEKSLSTMLYLMSLQQLSKAPFGLVDEINQGMDQHNERHLFKHLFETSSSGNIRQYFVITPKLLDNLPFNQSVSVCCVFNGPWLAPYLRRE